MTAIIRPTRAQKRYPGTARTVGRPPAVYADARTLRQLEQLGKCQCTTRETAGVLGVSHDTLMEFFNDCPEARECYENGKEHGKMSLRRKQINVAMEGNATMLIWTGKQYLGQSDKADVNQHVTLEMLIREYLPAVGQGQGQGRVIEGVAIERKLADEAE